MNYNDTVIAMSKRHADFVCGIASLARHHRLTPIEALQMFGVMAATMVDYDVEIRGVRLDVATEMACELFAGTLQRTLLAVPNGVSR